MINFLQGLILGLPFYALAFFGMEAVGIKNIFLQITILTFVSYLYDLGIKK